MAERSRSRSAAPGSPLIVCLDLQHAHADGSAPPDLPRRVGACQKLLAHARRCGWPVVHVLRGHGRTSPDDPDGTGPPLDGLQPRPFETVLFRTGLSAFSDRKFAALVIGERRPLVLLSVALGPGLLATALDAHDRGLRVTLVEDTLSAASAPPFPAETVRGVLLAVTSSVTQRTSLARMLRLMPAGEVLAAANDF